MFASADHHPGNTANSASKVTKGIVHKSDSVPRPGCLLERVLTLYTIVNK